MSFYYKGIDLSVATAFQVGGWAYDSEYLSGLSSSYYVGHNKDLWNTFDPTTGKGTLPVWNADDASNSFTQSSDMHLVTASYFSIRNITLGYSFPKSWMKKLNIEGIRIYASAENLALWSARQGFDRLCVYADIYYGEADDSRSTASRFPMLKGSRFELAAIKSSLGRKIPLRERSLKKATESDFRRLEFDPAARTIVHFSTHGFYFTVDEAPLYPYYSRYDVGNLIRYPLLRCGLAMAGADLVWVGAVTPESDRNDGILTAQEISEMDLRGVSLVVLAACQTGLGDISSEGVMGMQRAFRLAGVESMMVSLWPTNDNATAVLMAGFYAAMAAGMDAHEALRESVLALKNTPGMEDPYYWAPFIIVE